VKELKDLNQGLDLPAPIEEEVQVVQSKGHRSRAAPVSSAMRSAPHKKQAKPKTHDTDKEAGEGDQPASGPGQVNLLVTDKPILEDNAGQ